MSYLQGTGTNAQSSSESISSVRARIYGSTDRASFSGILQAEVYYDSVKLADLSVGTSLDFNEQWSPYVTLTVPTGGWTWAKVQALEVRYLDASSAFETIHAYRAEVEVTIASGNTGAFFTFF